jgi:hypothetical protein
MTYDELADAVGQKNFHGYGNYPQVYLCEQFIDEGDDGHIDNKLVGYNINTTGELAQESDIDWTGVNLWE